MPRLLGATLILALMSIFAGCSQDRPHDYGQQRPPVGDLDPRDSGLQSKDLVVSTDELANDLMALPELSGAPNRWTIVFMDMENQTTDPRFDYNIFLGRLKTNVSRLGHGRVAIIENRDKYRDLQQRELEPGARDEFGQGAGGAVGGAGIQPDFALYGKVQELPNRATSTYRMEFTLTNMRTREQVWTNDYLVKVAR